MKIRCLKWRSGSMTSASICGAVLYLSELLMNAKSLLLSCLLRILFSSLDSGRFSGVVEDIGALSKVESLLLYAAYGS